MADVGLDPALSKLALAGCKATRMAFCDGPTHNCTVNVDELGAIVQKTPVTLAAAPDFSLKNLVAGHSLIRS
jgi:hypothetical protein